METRTTIALVGLGSFGIGFAGGFFTGKLRAEKVAETYIQEELQREMSKLRHPSNIAAQPSSDEVVVPEKLDEEAEKELQGYLSAYQPMDGEVVVDQDEDEDVIIVRDEETGETRTVYNPDVEMPELPEDLIEHRREIDEDDTIPQREKWRVTVISPDEFRIGEGGQTREKLTYYEADDTVADSDGNPVDDPTLFGDGLANFGLFGAPNDTVYIRNREAHVDMHIVKVKGSYSELVAGVPMWKEDASPRKMRAYHE